MITFIIYYLRWCFFLSNDLPHYVLNFQCICNLKPLCAKWLNQVFFKHLVKVNNSMESGFSRNMILPSIDYRFNLGTSHIYQVKKKFFWVSSICMYLYCFLLHQKKDQKWPKDINFFSFNFNWMLIWVVAIHFTYVYWIMSIEKKSSVINLLIFVCDVVIVIVM